LCLLKRFCSGRPPQLQGVGGARTVTQLLRSSGGRRATARQSS
jgi:hypothetical protein